MNTYYINPIIHKYLNKHTTYHKDIKLSRKARDVIGMKAIADKDLDKFMDTYVIVAKTALKSWKNVDPNEIFLCYYKACDYVIEKFDKKKSDNPHSLITGKLDGLIMDHLRTISLPKEYMEIYKDDVYSERTQYIDQSDIDFYKEEN